jgi:hypothetical protein
MNDESEGSDSGRRAGRRSGSLTRRLRQLTVNLGRWETAALLLAIALTVAMPIVAWPRRIAVMIAPIIVLGLLLPRLRVRSLTRNPGSVRRMLRVSFAVLGLAAGLYALKVVPGSLLLALSFVGLYALALGITFWVYSDPKFLETEFIRSE